MVLSADASAGFIILPALKPSLLVTQSYYGTQKAPVYLNRSHVSTSRVGTHSPVPSMH